MAQKDNLTLKCRFGNESDTVSVPKELWPKMAHIFAKAKAGLLNGIFDLGELLDERLLSGRLFDPYFLEVINPTEEWEDLVFEAKRGIWLASFD